MTDPTSGRDELAALIDSIVTNDPPTPLKAADAILARWRLVPVEQDDAPIMEWHVHQWSDAEGHGMRCKECGDRVWIGIDPPARKMTMRRP